MLAPYHNLHRLGSPSAVITVEGVPTPYFVRFLNRKLKNLEDAIMARKYANQNTNSWKNDFTFVDYRLSTDEKKRFVGWLENLADDWTLAYGTFAANGYKTSLVFTEVSNCWIASATCVDEKSPNYQKVLTSRHADWPTALLLNVFKHTEIFENGVWPDKQVQSDWG